MNTSILFDRMKKSAVLTLFLAASSLSALRAVDTTYEANGDYSYVGGANMKYDGKGIGSLSEQSNQLHFAVSTQLGEGPLLRVGAEWQRYSFSSLPQTARIPNTLQSMNLIVGLDAAFWGWLVRIEAQPGYYGNFDQINGRGFNIPFIVGGMYLVSPDLQWVLGMSVNVERSIPVLPAAGVRWKFAKDWVFNAVLPRPRLEYTLNKITTLYAGGDFKLGTYRMDSSFGSYRGNTHLNNALVDYTEIRVGGGVEVKAGSSVKIDLETGCMVYRQFDYQRANISMSNSNGAPYGQIIVSCSF
ncbi:MAG: DUF6268 family outer membrane beta-barrel protein [Verrucomicrobiota bacterium]